MQSNKNLIQTNKNILFFSVSIYNFGLLGCLYEKFIGTKLSITSGSDITLDCSKEGCMSLFRALAAFKLPATNNYTLMNVPVDSKFVRAFTANLSKNQKQFYFNLNSTGKLESNKYIRELKLAAANTADHFIVDNLVFSAEDFISLVVAAKHTKSLYIFNSSLPLDCKLNFGEQLDLSDVQGFCLDNCGSADRGDWAANPSRFENLLEAISKCLPFKTVWRLYALQAAEYQRKRQSRYARSTDSISWMSLNKCNYIFIQLWFSSVLFI